MRLLVTPTSFTGNKELLRQLIEKAEVTLNPTSHPLSEEELLSFDWDFDGFIAGLDDVTARVIEKASPRLKVISRYGVGYDKIDIQTAGRQGIVVTNTPGANTESVADLTFALILAAARNLIVLTEDVKSGKWPRRQSVEIYGKTLGLIGFGAIGKAVAKRASGFSMKVLAYDPYDKSSIPGVKLCDLDTLLSSSDIISLHVPLNKETEGLIGEEAFSKMKDGVIVINTARGGLIDEQAALTFIENGKITAMGLDAFSEEPPKNCGLLKYPNVIATPHAGAHTKEATIKMAELAVQNLFDILEGRDSKHIVNRKYLEGANS